MLESSLFESGGRAPTRKPSTLIVSTILHGVAIVALLALPLLQPQIVPMISAAAGIPLEAIAKPIEKVPPAPAAPSVQPHIQPAPTDFIAPTSIPADIARVVDEPGAIVLDRGFGPVNSGINDVLRRMTAAEVTSEPPPPPPPPAPMPAVSVPLRRGGNVQQANLIYQVKPDYPALARQARVQGVVVLEATISKEGVVTDVRVINGHVLLIEAAKAAVQQWRYKPTVLNGEPIEVITTVTVTFSLQ